MGTDATRQTIRFSSLGGSGDMTGGRTPADGVQASLYSAGSSSVVLRADWFTSSTAFQRNTDSSDEPKAAIVR